MCSSGIRGAVRSSPSRCGRWSPGRPVPGQPVLDDLVDAPFRRGGPPRAGGGSRGGLPQRAPAIGEAHPAVLAAEGEVLDVDVRVRRARRRWFARHARPATTFAGSRQMPRRRCRPPTDDSTSTRQGHLLVGLSASVTPAASKSGSTSWKIGTASSSVGRSRGVDHAAHQLGVEELGEAEEGRRCSGARPSCRARARGRGGAASAAAPRARPSRHPERGSVADLEEARRRGRGALEHLDRGRAARAPGRTAARRRRSCRGRSRPSCAIGHVASGARRRQRVGRRRPRRARPRGRRGRARSGRGRARRPIRRAG